MLSHGNMCHMQPARCLLCMLAVLCKHMASAHAFAVIVCCRMQTSVANCASLSCVWTPHMVQFMSPHQVCSGLVEMLQERRTPEETMKHLQMIQRSFRVLVQWLTDCRLSFFNSIKYNIGGQEFSANDMEHGVLRGNRPTPASPWVLLGVPNWSSGYFKSSDPRAAHVSSCGL